MHPKFPSGSKAGLIYETDKGSGPLDLHSPVTEYGPEDDVAIEKYTREFGQYSFHFKSPSAVLHSDTPVLWPLVSTTWHAVRQP